MKVYIELQYYRFLRELKWFALGPALLFSVPRAWCHLEMRGQIIWEAKA